MARKTEIKEEIIIPDNVEITLKSDNLTVKGEKGSISRVFSFLKIDLKIESNVVKIHCNNPRKKEKALMGTFVAHINNMIKGVTEEFEYKMKTVFSHFPIKTSVEGNEFVIQNFLGERSPRRAKILEGVTVEAKGGEFRNKRHLETHLTSDGIIKEDIKQ